MGGHGFKSHSSHLCLSICDIIERMKKCKKCNKEKRLFEFNKNSSKKDGLQSYCKLCQNSYHKSYYERNKSRWILSNSKIEERNRKFIYEYLSQHPCEECGENDPIVLEFHHKANKSIEVSVVIKNKISIEKIKLEIEKCSVLCANCHKRITAKEFNWYKFKYSQGPLV